MADLSYKIYTVPDQTEHTCALSEAMLYSSDHRHILQDVYSSPIIPAIDQADIRAFLSKFNYNDCKIILNGNDLHDRKDVKFATVIKEIQKDTYFGTKFKIYQKPGNCQTFTPQEW